MQIASPRIAALIAGSAALVPLSWIVTAAPAAAFQVGQSADYPACAIWLNDQGQPLRNKAGREIARKVPCSTDSPHRDVYEALPGEAPNTLVIHDASHHVECLMVLAPGSTTVMTQKMCQAWDG